MTKSELEKDKSKAKAGSVTAKNDKKATKKVEKSLSTSKEALVSSAKKGFNEIKEEAQHLVEEAELGHKPAPAVGMKFSSKITTLAERNAKDVTPQVQADSKSSLPSVNDAQLKNAINNLTPEQMTQLKAKQQGPQQSQAGTLLTKSFEKLVIWADVAINYMTVPKNDPSRSEVVNYTRSSAIFGIWVAVITLLVFFIWGGFAPINKAANAGGSLVLESQKRIIQHPYGGIIDNIYVKEGDFVNKGQVLVSLNKVDAKADQEDSFNKYMTFLAENARLIAQRDDSLKIVFPEELLSSAANDKIGKIIHSQEKIFVSRLDTMNSEINIEENKIHQATTNKKAYEEMLSSIDQKIENFKKDLEAYKSVNKSGAASPTQVRQVENQLGQAMNEKIEYISRLNQTEDEILKEQSIIAAIKSRYLQETSKELRGNMQDLVTAKEHYLRADDKLNRSEIRAPVTGYVSNLQKIYTDGGVLQQVQPIMEIIPEDDVLVADVQISANDIDIVRKGQTALVMIMPFKNRVVPKIKGTLVSISPDAISVQGNGQTPGYAVYNGRIEMDPKELEDVKNTKGVKLYPGMPVQVFIEVGPRTLLRYLLDPFLMSFDRAFREE